MIYSPSQPTAGVITGQVLTTAVAPQSSLMLLANTAGSPQQQHPSVGATQSQVLVNGQSWAQAVTGQNTLSRSDNSPLRTCVGR